MSDDADKEVAKAVAAVSNAVGKTVDAASGVGRYLADTLGRIPEDLLGLLGGDWLHEQRKRNLSSLQEKTRIILESRPDVPLIEPSLSLVILILENARDEGREEIVAIWAALLAEAMSPNSGRVRRQFFDVVRKMEPDDAIVFDLYRNFPRYKNGERFMASDWQNYLDTNLHLLDIPGNRREMAHIALRLLGCISPWIELAANPVIDRPTALGEGLLDILPPRKF